MPDISLVIPAYNEAERIVGTVTDALEYFARKGLTSEIIVSADGTDNTRERVSALAATRPGIVILGSRERRGKGRGIREGVARATGDVIGFSDADNKTPIDELDKVLPLLTDGADLVIGSRAGKAALIERPQKLYRRIGSRGFALFMHAAVGLNGIADTQCGFKFFRGDVARDLFTRQQIDGYMYDVEILYLAKCAGYRLEQVPVRWRDDGDSRLDLIAGNVRNVRDVLSVRWMHRRAAPRRVPEPGSPRP
jgi:dolichyl-phosphate beta-glucosyltransferase